MVTPETQRTVSLTAIANMTRRHYIFCPHLTPYNDYLFRRISEAHANTQVIYRNRSLGTHPWQSNLGEGYSMSYERRVFGISWSTVGLAVSPRRAFYLVEGWDTPTMQVLLTLLRLFSRDFAIWTDTPNLTRKGPWMRERLRAAWLRWIFRGARANMGTGRPGTDGLRSMGAPENTLVNFPFVLESGAYKRPSPRPEVSLPMRFVSSGRVQNWLKGHDLALHAFHRAAQRTGIAFEYYIAGTGPDKEAIEALAASLGLERSVTCMGWTEPGNLQALLRSSDVLVHPSPVQDPFPNSVLEGMAAGMAILGSSACGSVVDRVVPEVSGLIHPPGAWEVLAEHIEFCLRSPDIVMDMGRRSEQTSTQWPVDRSVMVVKDLIEGRFPALAQKPWPSAAMGHQS